MSGKTRLQTWTGAVALAVWTLLTANPAAAQRGSAGSEPYLMELRSKRVLFRYTPGSLDRATRLEDPLELLVGEVASWGKQPVNLLVVLLAREEWERMGLATPYGLPGHLGPHDLVLPAWGDDQTVELWRGLLGRELPSPLDMAYGGNSLQYASLNMADHAMFPETAGVLLDKAGFAGDRPWVAGVTAHTVALSILADGAPTRMPEARYFWRSLREQGGGPGARTLAEAQAGGLRERLWLEATYFAAAWEMVASEGKSAGKNLLKRARKSANTVRAADLLERHPSLRTWLVESFADGRPAAR